MDSELWSRKERLEVTIGQLEKIAGGKADLHALLTKHDTGSKTLAINRGYAEVAKLKNDATISNDRGKFIVMGTKRQVAEVKRFLASDIRGYLKIQDITRKANRLVRLRKIGVQNQKRRPDFMW